MRFSKCDHPECTGHLAKFENCLSEGLYNADDWTESTGDADYGLTVSLIIMDESFTLPAYVSGLSFDLHVRGPLYAVMTCDDQGFVELTGFDTEALARDCFDREADEYGAWVEASESVGV